MENTTITYEISAFHSLHKHALALARDGQVLVSGNNECDTLGMPEISFEKTLWEFKPVSLPFKAI